MSSYWILYHWILLDYIHYKIQLDFIGLYVVFTGFFVLDFEMCEPL